MILLFLLLGLAYGWNTLYSYDNGLIYVHLKNNDLVSLNFSLSEVALDYTDSQTISTLDSPPENSTLVLLNQELYAFTSNWNDEDNDVCGEGLLSLVKYNSQLDSWEDFDENLNFDDINDGSYYRYSTYLTSPASNSTVYIYGGRCEENGDVTNRLLSLDLDSFKFSNISTSTKPQAFYGATNLLAPNPQTQLVLGGQSSLGWLSMDQLATWDFSLGWSSKLVSSDSDINSRKFALALPIYNSLSDDSTLAFLESYETKDVLLVGGELLGEAADPNFAKLSTDSNDWSWTAITNASSLDLDQILGAATIFNTLVVVNSTSSSKRSQSYTINLYDTTTFESVSSVTENSSLKKTTSKNSVQTKAILGTVIPVAAIAAAVGVGLFIMRKRRNSQDEDVATVDYEFGTYANTKSGNDNESNVTLDVNSIDSWVKKRQEFDQNRQKTIKRSSYLASNETLHEHPVFTDENPFADVPPPVPPKESLEKELPERPGPLPCQETTPDQTKPTIKSVSRLRKSFSFTSTPPGSPLIKKKKSYTYSRPSEFLREENSDDDYLHEKSDLLDIPAVDDSSSCNSLDEGMDVQVLVSSKRRLKLRIVNPDLSSVNDTTDQETIERDDESDNSTIEGRSLVDTFVRKRVPSGDHSDAD